MDKQLIAARLSQTIGHRVSVGLHSRLEDIHAFEPYLEQQRQPDRVERVQALMPDGTPAVDDSGRPIEGERKTVAVVFEPRVRKKLVEQKRIDLGEKYSYVGDDGAEHFVDDAAIAAAIADLEANPPPPPPIHVTYAALRARMTDAEVEAIHALRKSHWQVDDFVMAAASERDGVNLRGARVAAAKALLVQLGVFDQARADAVFAP